jgi:NADH:ubiquinone oxidoreductase subunit 6 (subunit J)
VTTPPSHWRDSAMRLAWTVLAIAVMLYIAARLILAVLPVLIIAGGIGFVGIVGWSIYQFRRSRW